MTKPETMRALVQLHDGYAPTAEGPHIESLEPYLEYREIPVPEPRVGQALIRVILANINPSDLHFIKGEYGQPRVAGAPAGFEAVGEVVAAGEGGEGLVGKRVAFFTGGSGAWADYAIAEVTSCVPLRDDVRDEDGAALLVNPMSAIAMFEEVAKSQSKSFIMTAAASQLCKLMAGLARDEGVSAIAIVRRDGLDEPLKQVGAAHVLNSAADGFRAELAELMREEKPRVLFDALADPVAANIFALMPNRARWIIYGKLASEPPVLEQTGQLIFMSKRIEGFWLVDWMRTKPPAEQIAAIAKVQERFATGKWQTDVRTIVPLAEAFEKLPGALAGQNTGKVMIAP